MSSDDKPTVDELRRSRESIELPREPQLPARYASGGEIARGGMGRVVEATDTLLGRVVAVKEALSTEPDTLQRFQRETNLTARLEHPSIVPVYDAGTTADGSPYYVMRKVSGRPLEELVAAADQLNQRLALLPNLLAAAQAVAHAHGRGILHRDLKPSNILVGDLGETVVIDWGLAKVIDEPTDLLLSGPARAIRADTNDDNLKTKLGTVFGTPGFMAPEQLRGEPAQRASDVYALGATLYYLLARRPPHSAESGTAMMAAAAMAPPKPIAELVSGTPRELATIVDKALAFRAQDRYPDAGAFAEDVRLFLAGQLVASHRYSARERLQRFVKRHRVPVAAVTLAVLALAIGGVFSVRQILSERDRADASAQLAIQRQREAELAQARERDRADQLLLTQARTLVASNPTAAVAMLKQLADTPERWTKTWRRARAIAADARIAGVAWGFPGMITPMTVRMSYSGERAVVTGREPEVYLYELATREHRVLATHDELRRAVFVGDRYVITFAKQQLSVHDLDRGTRLDRTLPTEILDIDTSSDRLYYLDTARKLWRMEVPGGVPERAPYDGEATSLKISHDHTQLALLGKQPFVVLDLATYTVRQLGPTGASGASWSTSSKMLAVVFDNKLARIEVATGETQWFTWSNPITFPISLERHAMAANLYGGLLASGNSSLRTIYTGNLDVAHGLWQSAGDVVVASTGNKLLLLDGARQLEVSAPVDGLLRIAASPRGRFAVGVARGHVLVWDLNRVLTPPKRLVDQIAVFKLVGNTDVLVHHLDARWSWIDRSANTSVELPSTPFMTAVTVNKRRDTALFIQPQRGMATVVDKATATSSRIEVDAVMGAFVDDHHVMLATTAGAIVHYELATRRSSTLFSHAAEPGAIAWEGDWVAALYADGTVWRRNLATGVEGRIKLPPPRKLTEASLRILADGRLYVPGGRKVVRWELDGALVDHVTFPLELGIVTAVPDHLLVTTVDGAAYLVGYDRVDKVVANTPPGTRVVSVSEATNLAVFETAGRTPGIVDLEVAEQWPVVRRGQGSWLDSPGITDDGRTIAAIETGNLIVWDLDLPWTAEATKVWLGQLTNATAELGPTTMTWH